MFKKLASIGLILTLGGCGAAADLKDRWVELPTPPNPLTHSGPGTYEVQDADIANISWNMRDMEVLVPFFDSISPEHASRSLTGPLGGYTIDFNSGVAVLDLGEDATQAGVARLTLSFGDDDLYYSDANGDGRQDLMIVLHQRLESWPDGDREADPVVEEGSGIILVAYTDTFLTPYYLKVDDPTEISAINGGFSYTTPIERVNIGLPSDVPGLIDSVGGSVVCPRDMASIEAAIAGPPHKIEELKVYPGGPVIEGFKKDWTYFEADSAMNPDIARGQKIALYLVEGGDMHRASDYRCGWR